MEMWQSPDGHCLFWQYFPAKQAKALLLLVHGIGEHIGRYADVIPVLNTMGLAVLAYDQYGHGRSEGKRGTLDVFDRLDRDLQWVIKEKVRERGTQPLIVFGHSMGGAVVANRLAKGETAVDFAVLSSPALRPHLALGAKCVAMLMNALMPMMSFHHGLSLKVSHRQAVNDALLADSLCHKHISGRLATFIIQAGEYARQQASNWQVPTLLLYAGQDYLVHRSGSDEFAKKAPACVQAQCFEGYYHEIFHEIDTTPVYGRLAEWLDSVL